MTKLEMVIAGTELLQNSNALDCAVSIFNTEGIIIHQLYPRTFNFPAKIGDKAPGGAVSECLKIRQIIKRDVSAFGTKIRAINQPIFEDDGQIVGVLGVAINLQTVDTLHQASQTIAATSEEMNATIEELAATAGRLAEDLNKVRNGSKLVLDEINKTDDILKFVSDVAANSNLLGLNAAIEAARAGEHGRGFAVVADEIRKMAINSAQSVNDIKKILQKIQIETTAVVDTVTATAELGEQQAAATEQIGATMQLLTSTANDIEKVAQSI